MRTFYRILTNTELQTPCYIDPNTGGMIFQLLAVFLAVFSGVLFFFSRQIRTGFARLRRMIQGDKSADKAENAPEKPEDQS